MNAYLKGIPVDQTPAVGAIAQWNAGSDGHVAYVETTDASGITITDDNYYYGSLAPNGGYTDKIHIAVGSPAWPDNFIHFKDASQPPPNNPPPPTQVAVTTTVSSSANPSTFGQSVTLTTTVAPQTASANTPTGAVEMFDGAAEIGSGNLSNGTFSVTTSSLSVGTHPITASYAGDSNFLKGSSSTFNQVVNQAPTTTTVTSSANPSVFGQPVTLTATVAPTTGSGTPSGTVQLYSGTTSIGSGPLTNGSFSITETSLAVGTYPITAAYGGDTDFLSSTSALLNQVVNKAPTKTALTANSGSGRFGHRVTFTATVSVPPPGAGSPTGAMIFSVDGIAVYTTNLNGSEQASVTTSALAPGSHLISARYQGDGDFLGSSGTVSYVVTCTLTVTGDYAGALIASGDSTCVLDSTVTGAIVVPPGTSLAVINSTVKGSISAPDAAGTVEICGAPFVGGSIDVMNARGLVMIGDPGANCPVNDVGGSLVLEMNSHGVEAIGNTVDNIVDLANSGPGPYPGDGSSVDGNVIRSGAVQAASPSTTIVTAPIIGTPSTTVAAAGSVSTAVAEAAALETAALQAANSLKQTDAPGGSTSSTGPPANKLPPIGNPPPSTTPTVIDTRKRVATETDE